MVIGSSDLHFAFVFYLSTAEVRNYTTAFGFSS